MWHTLIMAWNCSKQPVTFNVSLRIICIRTQILLYILTLSIPFWRHNAKKQYYASNNTCIDEMSSKTLISWLFATHQIENKAISQNKKYYYYEYIVVVCFKSYQLVYHRVGRENNLTVMQSSVHLSNFKQP